ncbi:hypothetical protein ACM61V_06555 [Sphingomonas sp. TX0543]|uniref:hypothetical protein n=1 Tax=unclassified Sphingomonas TaxID=196159 RepID=UPI002015FB92|nr:hypothetical protein [Sphingomonas sp. 3P27F8]
MRGILAIAGSAACIAALAVHQGGEAQSATAPKARYVMDVSTDGGMMGNPMAAMMGRGGSSTRHSLRLRLGSTLAADGGAPVVDHFMPPAANLGASVRLVSPERTTGDETPGEFRRPKGRLLIFWGCGAQAGPGQPVVIDFAKVAPGQFPPGLFSASVPNERGPLPGNSRTYGDWPNAKDRKSGDRVGSILGDHRIAGNYAPEIKFALTQDFMPALAARSTPLPGGATTVSWGSIAGATGYYAWAMGGKSMGQDNADMVWWTSAGAREFGGGLSDWLSPATVSRLIGQKIVMPPSQTSCAIPQQVKEASGGMLMSFLYAYGPEQNFAYPPRPADPRAPWHPDWTAKVRYRSMTMLMPGMSAMGGAMEGRSEQDSQPGQPNKKRCKPGLGAMLGGMLGGKTC